MKQPITILITPEPIPAAVSWCGWGPQEPGPWRVSSQSRAGPTDRGSVWGVRGVSASRDQRGGSEAVIRVQLEGVSRVSTMLGLSVLLSGSTMSCC